MSATDNQIQPQLKRSESSEHISTIRTPAVSSKQQLSRFTMTPNKVAYDLTETRNPGPAGETLAQLRRCWRHIHGGNIKHASNLLCGASNGGEGNPLQNTIDANTIITPSEVQSSARDALTSSDELVQKLKPVNMLEKRASWLNTARYTGQHTRPGRQGQRGQGGRKVASLPVGGNLPPAQAPAAPIPTPPEQQPPSGGMPVGMAAQQAGLPVGQGVAAVTGSSPAGAPPGVPPAGGGNPPAATPPLPAGQEQVAAAGGQPDPNAMAQPAPRPPSPLGRGQHLDTITPDTRKHPLNRLMDDATQSEQKQSPDDHEETDEDTSTIGGGGATRIKEAGMRASDHPRVVSLWSSRPRGATSEFIPLHNDMTCETHNKTAAEPMARVLSKYLGSIKQAGILNPRLIQQLQPSRFAVLGRPINRMIRSNPALPSTQGSFLRGVGQGAVGGVAALAGYGALRSAGRALQGEQPAVQPTP